MKKVKTPEQVKAEFHRKGLTFSGWARQHGYREQEVYRVLNGFAKAKYGKAHEIAVKLGLKVAA
jgi:gp16